LIWIEPDAQNGIAMAITVPLLQYAGVGLFFIAAFLGGWRRAGRSG
jgi:hypothetical protein